jgi:hypothetical protein
LRFDKVVSGAKLVRLPSSPSDDAHARSTLFF